MALVGLSAFQARRHPRLVWAAFAIPAAGAVVALLGVAVTVVAGDSDAEVFAGADGWMISTLGLLTLILGSGLFALATWRAQSLSRWAAGLLGFGSFVVVPALSGITGGFVPEALLVPAIIITILAFPAGWIALGVSALRVGPATVTTFEGASL